MVKITISSKKEENFKEGDLVFGAALSWEDPGSHMDAFIVGEIDKEKFLYTFAGAVANILANTVPNEYSTELGREFVKKFALHMKKIKEGGEKNARAWNRSKNDSRTGGTP